MKKFIAILIATCLFAPTAYSQIKIDNNGNVGIRVLTTLGSHIETAGNIFFHDPSGGSNGDFYLDNSGNYSTTTLRPWSDWTCSIGTSSQMFMDIWTYHILYQNITNLSDARYKENITDIKSSLDKIMMLRPVSYDYKLIDKDKYPMEALENMTALAQGHFGFLAQEVQPIYGNLVVNTDQDKLGLNYVEMIPLLVRAMQEQQDKIDALESTLSNSAESGLKQILINSIQVKNVSPDESVLDYNINLKDDSFKNLEASMIVTDLTGKLISQSKLESSEGQIKIAKSQLAAGIYIASISINGIVIKSEKFLLD